jgi:hypothetical protein
MQYAVLIYTEPDVFERMTDEEREAISKRYWALRDDPHVLTGAALQHVRTATTVRAQDGQTLVTDGPFANTKEVFGGFYLLEADDLDAAIEFAASLPTLGVGGAVEIRPLLEGGR